MKKSKEKLNVEETNTTVVAESDQKQPKKLTFKEKKDRFFNAIYIITTLFSFLYYVYYACKIIKENGFHSEIVLQNVVSYMLVIAVIVYALILIVCAIMSSSVKTAKSRISKASVYLGYFKKSIKILTIIVSIIVIASSLVGEKDLLTTIIAGIQLTFTILKLIFKTASLSAKIGVNATKKIVKHSIKKRKEKKLASKSKDNDANSDNQ